MKGNFSLYCHTQKQTWMFHSFFEWESIWAPKLKYTKVFELNICFVSVLLICEPNDASDNDELFVRLRTKYSEKVCFSRAFRKETTYSDSDWVLVKWVHVKWNCIQPKRKCVTRIFYYYDTFTRKRLCVAIALRYVVASHYGILLTKSVCIFPMWPSSCRPFRLLKFRVWQRNTTKWMALTVRFNWQYIQCQHNANCQLKSVICLIHATWYTLGWIYLLLFCIYQKNLYLLLDSVHCFVGVEDFKLKIHAAHRN